MQLGIFLVAVALCVGAGVSLGQDAEAAPGPDAQVEVYSAMPADAVPQASVDWFEEMREGGLTMLALAVLSIAMVVFVLERSLRLRASRLVPAGLVSKVVSLAEAHQYDQAAELCRKDHSAFAEIGGYLITHRHVDPQLTMNGAGDLAARAIDKESERAYPLAVIAALAPLLGLLGTMIGMIEAFKLVEVFGDEGGASLLAGSISKALITTAVGLILAIPALIAYHFFRHRVNLLADRLEREADAVFRACYFKTRPQDADEAAASTHPKSAATAKPVSSGAGSASNGRHAAEESGRTTQTHATTPAPRSAGVSTDAPKNPSE